MAVCIVIQIVWAMQKSAKIHSKALQIFRVEVHWDLTCAADHLSHPP